VEVGLPGFQSLPELGESSGEVCSDEELVQSAIERLGHSVAPGGLGPDTAVSRDPPCYQLVPRGGRERYLFLASPVIGTKRTPVISLVS
jgi:hypothetical protein